MDPGFERLELSQIYFSDSGTTLFTQLGESLGLGCEVDLTRKKVVRDSYPLCSVFLSVQPDSLFLAFDRALLNRLKIEFLSHFAQLLGGLDLGVVGFSTYDLQFQPHVTWMLFQPLLEPSCSAFLFLKPLGQCQLLLGSPGWPILLNAFGSGELLALDLVFRVLKVTIRVH